MPVVHRVVERIKERNKIRDIVLLDYNTNTDFRDVSKPLSHAGLVKLYIEGNYPNGTEGYTPMSEEEIEAKRTKEKGIKKELRKSVKTKKNTQIGNMFDELNTKE